MSEKPDEKDVDEDVSLDDEDAEQITGGVQHDAGLRTEKGHLKTDKPGVFKVHK